MRIAQAERRDESRRGRHECLRHGGSAENLVAEADQYPWSSAAAHCAAGRADAGLEMDPWQGAWDAARWREYLHAAGAGADAEAIRRSTHSGRPLGAADFVADLERELRRHLAAQRGGRRPKQRLDERQEALAFD